MNTIYDSNHRVIGFKCFECGKVVASMWGETCNSCRAKQERHEEKIAEIKKLREEIRILNKKLKNKKETK
jgi:DNA-directed RNA polymerase subunit N (RpoN/RPB10)